MRSQLSAMTLNQIHHALLSFGFSLNVALRRAERAVPSQHLHVTQRAANG